MAGPGGTRTVVFDLDGTLADTAADLVAAANACFRAMGAGEPLDPAADAVTAGRGGRALLRLGFGRSGRAWDEADIERWYPPFLAEYEAAIDRETQLHAGAAEALAGLRGLGFAMAVCTNKPERLATLLLARLGVGGLFGAVVGADTLPVRKPDPRPYRAAVERAGGTVGRSFLVGDTETDRATALAAGVPAVLVTFGPQGAGVGRLLPDALLHRFADLPDLAGRLLPPV
ncbi:MAG: HAD-IA family hydrolase [Rhodobacteraceae bacterium]|nr:HAD-IA family hydrolase [Paracoccaceae bacterium]